MRSLSVYELTTGVWRTMPVPACAARRMSCAETGVLESAVETGAVGGPSVRERHHRVDLDHRASRQRRHADRHARGRIGFEE